MGPSPETAQSDVDANTLLARIEDPKARRAAEDLLGDWERQGFVEQAQIDRLAMIRQLLPAQLAEVITFLRAIGAQADEEPEPEELLLCESLVSESDLDRAPGKRAERDQNAERLLTPNEVFELSNAIQLGIQAARSSDSNTGLPVEQQRIIARGQQARERMIICNQGLVRFVAQHFQVHPAFTIEDLNQEGILGLITAIETYDPARGCRFSTYAIWWIRQAILRALASALCVAAQFAATCNSLPGAVRIFSAPRKRRVASNFLQRAPRSTLVDSKRFLKVHSINYVS